ncbi:MAG: tetratricopeptide repeat protein [Anaerolineales bacterium]|nr:tetratricopeptide repeat protein [Anaerolineales bacterium]
MDQERANVIRAIAYALDMEEAWPSVYELIMTFSLYMEKRGYWDNWNQILRRAAKAAEQNNDTGKGINLSVLLARLLFQQSRFKEAVICYRQTLHLTRQLGDRFNEGRICSNLGYYYIERGQWYRAEALCCHALSLFEQINSAHGRAHTENHLGILYTWQQRWDQAQKHLEQACKLWSSMQDEYGLMRGYINLGGLYNWIKYPDKSMFYLEKALHQAQLTGAETDMGTIYMNMGVSYRLAGDFSMAENYAKQAEIIFQHFSNTTGLAQVWDNMGVLYFKQGKLQKANQYLERSLNMWRTLNNRKGEIRTLMEMIEFELATGNLLQAQILLKKVEQLIGQNRMMQYQDLQERFIYYHQQLGEHSTA